MVSWGGWLETIAGQGSFGKSRPPALPGKDRPRLLRRARAMIYRVKAKYIESKLGQFYHQLTDGTIFRQRPDGEEIFAV